MPKRHLKLTKTVVAKAAPEASLYKIHDTAISGFSLFVRPNGKKSFFLRYRVRGGRAARIREPKIGDASAMTAEQARKIAADWSAVVRLGGDPAAEKAQSSKAPTMHALFERYVEEHARFNKKRSSLRNDEAMIARILGPKFGALRVADVSRPDIVVFHKSLVTTPYQANRVLALLSKAFQLAEVWEWRPENSYPTRLVKKYKEVSRKRYLSQLETERLARVLDDVIAERPLNWFCSKTKTRFTKRVNPYAGYAVKLLLLTGARCREILSAKWSELDREKGQLALPDTKTGARTIFLSKPALDLLLSVPRQPGNAHIICGGRPGDHLKNLKDPWGHMREAAELKDFRLHDLRHSYASFAVASGMSLPVLGALLGHSQPGTTARYAHLADNPLRAATEQVADAIPAIEDGRRSS
ncbi:tyrosine-type recombinase/integrase [Tropicimonas sp. S265A]|uniref:tyrosine-type recombinase/integrase n=1 Tax=Tropicimonas sp. S265A TaxID=3415134 RepID=UPI003C7A9AB9